MHKLATLHFRGLEIKKLTTRPYTIALFNFYRLKQFFLKKFRTCSNPNRMWRHIAQCVWTRFLEPLALRCCRSIYLLKTMIHHMRATGFGHHCWPFSTVVGRPHLWERLLGPQGSPVPKAILAFLTKSAGAQCGSQLTKSPSTLKGGHNTEEAKRMTVPLKPET